MSTLLHIDASPRGDRSVTRQLSRDFVRQWTESHPETAVIYHDVGHEPPPHVSEPWIAAAFTPSEQRDPQQRAVLALSDQFIDEILAADTLVLGVPMYNLSVPSAFKAYIDQVVRVGRTFSAGPNGYEGLVKGKKVFVITARGGSFRPGTPLATYDFQEPYLRGILGFIGLTDVTFVHADFQSGQDEARTRATAEARARVGALAAA